MESEVIANPLENSNVNSLSNNYYYQKPQYKLKYKRS